jgi:hypothetical protein
MRNEPEVTLKMINSKIAWALQHPGTSPWLKSTLRGALEADPVCLANDLEMLRHLVQPLSEALLGGYRYSAPTEGAVGAELYGAEQQLGRSRRLSRPAS